MDVPRVLGWCPPRKRRGLSRHRMLVRSQRPWQCCRNPGRWCSADAAVCQHPSHGHREGHYRDRPGAVAARRITARSPEAPENAGYRAAEVGDGGTSAGRPASHLSVMAAPGGHAAVVVSLPSGRPTVPRGGKATCAAIDPTCCRTGRVMHRTSAGSAVGTARSRTSNRRISPRVLRIHRPPIAAARHMTPDTSSGGGSRNLSRNCANIGNSHQQIFTTRTHVPGSTSLGCQPICEPKLLFTEKVQRAQREVTNQASLITRSGERAARRWPARRCRGRRTSCPGPRRTYGKARRTRPFGPAVLHGRGRRPAGAVRGENQWSPLL